MSVSVNHASVDTVTKIFFKSCPEHLPRLRRIAACLADSVGMDEQEVSETNLALTEACANAIKYGSPKGTADSVFVRLTACSDCLMAEVTDSGFASPKPQCCASLGVGMRIMRTLTDHFQFIKRAAGSTVSFTKRAKREQHGNMIGAVDLAAPHRN